MPSFVPSVEERLRSSLVLCDTLKHAARLADDRVLPSVPPFTPTEVLRTVPGAMDVLFGQLVAMREALSSDTLNHPAPGTDGAR